MATTTPNYGWDVPTSSDYVKNGATAIETLGDDIDATLWTALGGNYPGLRLIKKQTIGTAVSTVAVTNAYSADYEAYKIIITGGVASANVDLSIINTGSTASYNYGLLYATFAGGAATNLAAQNAANFPYAGHGTTSTLRMNIDVLNPFLAKNTQFSGVATTNFLNGIGSCNHSVATSYTGFTITPSAGNITGGTIYVYGYGAS